MRVRLLNLAVGLLLVMAAMGTGAPTATAPLVKGPVTVMPATCETKIFDPQNLPSPPPPVTKEESAVCVGNSRCDISFGTETLYKRKAAEGSGYESAVRVSGIKMKISLQMTIWLPKGGSPWIREHEETHRQIFEQVYATADKEALATVKKFSGKTFTAIGKTTLEAEKNALAAAQKEITDDYTSHVCNVWARVNDLFDEITEHGMLSIPGKAGGISAAKAKEEAFKRYAAEQEARGGAATQPEK